MNIRKRLTNYIKFFNDKDKRGLSLDLKSLITDKTIFTRDKHKPWRQIKNGKQ